MESTRNLHHHLQDPPLEPSWTPNIISLNAGSNNNNLSISEEEEEEANPRSSSTDGNDNIGVNKGFINQDEHFDYVHESGLTTNFPKFSEMLSNSTNSPNSNIEASYDYELCTPNSTTTNHHQHMMKNNERLFLKTLFSDNINNTVTEELPITRGNYFSHIYPTINISHLNHQHHHSYSTSLDLTPPHQPSQQDHLLALATFPNTQTSSSSNHPSLEFTDATAVETKRPSTSIDSKASHSSQTPSKKSRSSESRQPSSAPFKVRKEKLGDRIAALQQLVAPFGKTDTASVLMEAIGYIKFLQGQVETLSVPYMKSSQNQSNRFMHGVCGGVGEGNGEAKQLDLRSRGLCLVPLSCMSYIAAGDGTNEVWQHHHFGGTT